MTEQLPLFSSRPEWSFAGHGAEAWEWIHTPMGSSVADQFIRLALYCRDHLGKTVGAKALWEKLRWEYEYSKPADQEWKLNNNHTRYVALFAESKVPTLKGYFTHREKTV